LKMPAGARNARALQQGRQGHFEMSERLRTEVSEMKGRTRREDRTHIS
jgi:hypothetical protein